MVDVSIGIVVMNTDSCFLFVLIKRLLILSYIFDVKCLDAPSIYAIQGDTAEADRGQEVGAVLESCVTHWRAPARVRCLCTYIGGAGG